MERSVVGRAFHFSFFVVILALIFSPLACADTLVVSGEGDEFKSLRDAVGRADSGDVIMIEPGNYEGGLKIKKDLTLKGTGADSVRVSGSERGHPVLLVGPVDVSVTVRGITLQGASGELCADRADGICPSGLSVVGNAKLSLNGSVLSRNGRDGMRAIGSAKVTVGDTKIQGNERAGAWLSGSSRLSLEGGEIVNNRAGVNLSRDARAVVIDSVIRSGGHGITVFGDSQITIKRTKIAENQRDGIRFFNSSRGTIGGSAIKNNSGRGLVIQDSALLTLQGTEVRKNAVGITNHSDRELKFSDNNVTENTVDLVGNLSGKLRSKEAGAKAEQITLPDEAYPDLQSAIDALEPGGTIILQGKIKGGAVISEETSIASRGKNGKLYLPGETVAPVLSLVKGGNLTLTGVTIEGSEGSGIVAAGNAGLELKNLDIDGSGEDGVGLWNTAGMTLVQGGVADSGGSGLRLVDSTRAVLKDLELTGNKVSGILLAGSSRAMLENSLVKGNGGHGVALFGSADGYGEGNEIKDNGSSGVKLAGSSRIGLEGCDIVGNGRDGVALFSSGWAAIRDSTVKDNTNGFSLRDYSWLIAEENSIVSNETGMKVLSPEDFRGEITGKSNRLKDNGKDFSGVTRPKRKKLVW